MKGTLIYMMGPSGVGKDTLLDIAKVRFADLKAIKFAKRYITKPADLVGEDFTSISRSAFDYLDSKGHFLFSWRSHGFYYGIDRQIEGLLQEGFMVIVNGSRAYLPKALERCPSLKPVLITAGAEALAARLKKRGRESFEEQAERLHQPDYEYKDVRNLHTIDNSGELRIAADRFCSFLSEEWAKIATPPGDLQQEARPNEHVIINEDSQEARSGSPCLLMALSGLIDKIRGKDKGGILKVSG